MAIHVQSALTASHPVTPRWAWGKAKSVLINLLDDLRHAYLDARAAEQEGRRRFPYVLSD
jgi:hypothetical protein